MPPNVLAALPAGLRSARLFPLSLGSRVDHKAIAKPGPQPQERGPQVELPGAIRAALWHSGATLGSACASRRPRPQAGPRRGIDDRLAVEAVRPVEVGNVA